MTYHLEKDKNDQVLREMSLNTSKYNGYFRFESYQDIALKKLVISGENSHLSEIKNWNNAAEQEMARSYHSIPPLVTKTRPI